MCVKAEPKYLVSYYLSMPRIRAIEFVISLVTLNKQDCQNNKEACNIVKA